MEKNFRKKQRNCKNNNFKSDNGITLVALIVTIIVLLILAAVSLSAVFNKNGIFSKAEQATKLYGKEKSRDELTIALADAEMKKYTSGLTEDELNEILNQVGQVDDNENTRVTVDGHIWQIDRDKLEIVDYLGEDDGIEIRYTIEGNDNYITGTPNIRVKVTVKNNKGTLDINSIQITKNGAPLTGIAISNSGEFELNVTETTTTTFTVSAKNSAGEQSTPKTIRVTPKLDTTPPTISNQSAVARGMNITISARAADNESGIKVIRYNISPETVDSTTPATGTLESGEEKVIKVNKLGEYTVTFIAENNVGLISTTVTAKATVDIMTAADANRIINASNYPEYLGMEVDYKPGDTKAWRVFYYDATGEFGDGAGTIYLKRDYDTTTILSSYTSHVPEDGGALMKQLNKAWANSANGKKATSAWLENEHCASWLCDSSKWTTYKTSEAKYAIGAAPIEMWCKAQNAYKNKYDTSASIIGCGILNENGYGSKIGTGGLETSQTTTIVNTSIEQSKVIATESGQWLASPTSSDDGHMCYVSSSRVSGNGWHNNMGFCPVVSLNH